MAIGGAIGTGLFMGSGKSISLAGPAITVVYAVIGGMLFFMMRAMGEMLLSRAVPQLQRRDRGRARAVGRIPDRLTYWVCWIITGIAEVVAVTGYTAYWWPSLPRWIPAVLMVVLIVGLNMLAVRLFGEMEFWFALIKIVAILALVVTTVVLVLTYFQAPTVTTPRSAISGRTEASCRTACTGCCWASRSPRSRSSDWSWSARQRPRRRTRRRRCRVRSTPSPSGSCSSMGWPCSRSWSSRRGPMPALMRAPSSRCSPWSVSPAAAGLINFVVLTSAASSCNSGTYSTSRMLFGLSDQGSAPHALRHLSARRTPDRALLVSAFFLMLSVPLIYSTDSVAEGFTLATTVSSVLFMVIWSLILVAYIVYRRTRPELHARSVYKRPGGVTMCWVVLGFFVFVTGTLLMSGDTRKGLAASLIWFAIMGIGLVLTKKDRLAAERREWDLAG